MWNRELYKRALDFAADAHGAQKVLGSERPYVVHVAKVAMEVMAAWVADPTLDVDLGLACALLQGTIEECGVEWSALADAFGPAVANGVRALTKSATLPRHRRLTESLKNVRAQPRTVWAVKLASRLTNLGRPPDDWTLEQRQRALAEAKEVLAALRGASAPLEARFEQKLAEYELSCR